MSLASRPSRHLLPATLGVVALSSCVCDPQTFTAIPDAGVDASVVVPDAGPPPPEFPLKVGDLLKHNAIGVTYCNESFSTNCQEHSSTWSAEYRIVEPGPTIDGNTNSWVVPAEYFWQVGTKKSPDPAIYQSLSKLWLTNFGPWESETGASLDPPEVKNFITTTAMLPTSPAESFPFFDVETRWDAAAQSFEAYVRSLDANPYIQVQKAARKFSAGYLDPDDNTLLHYVEVIYHRLGFVCSVNESIGPWAGGLKNDSSFSSNQRDYKVLWNSTQLTRATGPLANQRQFCKCGTGAGSDCE